MVTFAALGVAGCLMVPFRFFQMLSRRTLPGFAGVFALILGVELFLKDGGPSVTLFLSVVLWFLCFALAANQEYVIKYAYASHTCVVSSRVRRAGLRNAMRVWLTAVGMFLPAAGLLTFAVTGIRMLVLSGEGSSDSAVTVLGLIVGAAFAHNFGLASSAEGPTANGKIAVVIGLVVVTAIACLGTFGTKRK